MKKVFDLLHIGSDDKPEDVVKEFMIRIAPQFKAPIPHLYERGRFSHQMIKLPATKISYFTKNNDRS